MLHLLSLTYHAQSLLQIPKYQGLVRERASSHPLLVESCMMMTSLKHPRLQCCTVWCLMDQCMAPRGGKHRPPPAWEPVDWGEAGEEITEGGMSEIASH